MARTPSLTSAVTGALRSAQTKPEDAAAVALVKRYAALIDDAEDLAAEAALVELDDEDVSGRRRLARLEVMVSAHQVAADLGPKFLAALTALGMTLQGRAKPGGGKRDGEGTSAGPKPLDELRARRATRRDRAAAVDASTP